MLQPVTSLETGEAAEDRRYALVFEPTTRNLEAAVRFTSDPDRVLVGLEPSEQGTTAATIVPLLWVLSVDRDAQILVLLPARSGREAVFMGSAAHLADLVRRHAPEWWEALSSGEKSEPPELPASDLARDVLERAFGPGRSLPGHRATVHRLEGAR